MKKYRQEDWWFEERHGWELESVRDAIAWVDDQLISLMAERIRLGWIVARLKRRKGLPIFNPAQEERVVNRWIAKAGEEGLPQESVRKIVDILMEATKAIQHEFLEIHSEPGDKDKPAGKD